MEVSQTLGISLFMFKVLPSVPNVNGLFLMNAVCLIPAILKILFSSRRGMTRLQKFLVFILDVVSLLCQSSIWFIFYSQSFYYKANPSSDPKMRPDGNFIGYVIASTILISLGWWETYAEVRFSTNRLTIFVQNQINDLRKHRHKIYVFLSPLKVFLTFLFGYLLLPPNLQQQYMNFGISLSTNGTTTPVNPSSMDEPNIPIEEAKLDAFTLSNGFFWPLIIHFVSSAICYFTARLACKVLMQGLGFALPLALTTPICYVILLFASMQYKTEKLIFLSDGPFVDLIYLDGFNR